MKIEWKKAVGLVAAAAMLVPLAACGTKKVADVAGDYEITVAAPQEDQQGDNSWLSQVEKKFEEAHPTYNIKWTNVVLSEGDAATKASEDPAGMADVYMYANDQLGTLVNKGSLGPIYDEGVKEIKANNAQSMVDSVTGTDGNIYGVPYTANTWFMFYNKAKYSEDDVKSFDTLLEKGKVSFPLTNSWYLPAFYTGAGATLFGESGSNADDGIKLGDKAAAVTKYLVSVANNANFINDDDTSGLANLQSGKVDVYFSGTWNAATVKEALKDNYGAAQLPSFKLDGSDVQMKAFAGSKAVGYNPISSHNNGNENNTLVSNQFAAFLGGTEAQKLHWETRQIIPTDKTLENLDGMSDEPSVAAQMNTINNASVLQPTIAEMGIWWDPCKTFGQNIANKKVTADDAEQKTTDWQNQIDKALENFKSSDNK